MCSSPPSASYTTDIISSLSSMMKLNVSEEAASLMSKKERHSTNAPVESQSGTPKNGAVALGPLMEGLSEEERLKIASVLQRDLHMQKQDQQRVAAQKLTIAAYADDLENRNRRMAAKTQRQRPATGVIMTQIERKCAICAGRLGYVKKAGLICEDCHNRICSECSRWWYLTTAKNAHTKKIRLCRLCVMQRLVMGKWLQSTTGTPNKKDSVRTQAPLPSLVPEGQSPSASFFTTIKECTPNMEQQLAHMHSHQNKRRQSGSMLDASKQHLKGQFQRRRKSVTSLLDSAIASSCAPTSSNRESPQSERRSSAGLSTKLGVVQAIRRRSCTNLTAKEGENLLGKPVKSPSVDACAVSGNRVKKLFSRGRAKSAMRAPNSMSISIDRSELNRPQTPTICLISPDHSDTDSDDWILSMCTDVTAGLRDQDPLQMNLPKPSGQQAHSATQSGVTIHINGDSNSGSEQHSPVLKRNSEGNTNTPKQLTPEKRRKSWTNVFKNNNNSSTKSNNNSSTKQKTKKQQSEPTARIKQQATTNSLCVPVDDDDQSGSDHNEPDQFVQNQIGKATPMNSKKGPGKLKSLFSRRKSSERQSLPHGAENPKATEEKGQALTARDASSTGAARRYNRRKSAC